MIRHRHRVGCFTAITFLSDPADAVFAGALPFDPCEGKPTIKWAGRPHNRALPINRYQDPLFPPVSIAAFFLSA
jgi:hypothetical protein